ncbi:MULTISPECIES: RNA-binding S4 domain-containing protein [unclassified Schaalia]|uniref:RNA-binding S4 domain-containing protein n=1 Tax=unclassified Schaalia TaxID=2691889 RepID=UPI001E2FB7E6|nr:MULTISPECIES: RNA-binding S4 domain-containing protein [unclassified Schaalia]MCD4549888.1 RNA-binding S4 domain-containing protein [Schaalia sp. lx-260]MCD4556904.1 RNA-binding S4 domain-containing protein [Schaalia sp. lx-100]
MSDIQVIHVQDVIRLGQFLKLANMVENGAMARDLIQGGDVYVNGAVETRRGFQLPDLAVVEVDSPWGTQSAQVAYSR